MAYCRKLFNCPVERRVDTLLSAILARTTTIHGAP
jgi:hypothetical protein